MRALSVLGAVLALAGAGIDLGIVASGGSLSRGAHVVILASFVVAALTLSYSNFRWQRREDKTGAGPP